VRESLGKFNIAPTLDFDKEVAFDIPYDMKFQPAIEPQIKVNPNYNPFHTNTSTSHTKKESDYTNKSLQSFGFEKQASPTDWGNFYQIEEEQTLPSQMNFQDEVEQTPNEVDFENIQIIKNTAVVVFQDQFWAIHLGKANERIVYDNLFNTFITHTIPAQRLLFPIELKASHQEELCWKENQKIIARLGFEWEFSNEVLEIISIPAIVESEDSPYVLQEIRDQLMNEHVDKGDLAHVLIAAIARGSNHSKNWNKLAAQLVLEKWYLTQEKTIAPDGSKILKVWNPLDLIK
jgi:DNA mismatch repair protein MutL